MESNINQRQGKPLYSRKIPRKSAAETRFLIYRSMFSKCLTTVSVRNSAGQTQTEPQFMDQQKVHYIAVKALASLKSLSSESGNISR